MITEELGKRFERFENMKIINEKSIQRRIYKKHMERSIWFFLEKDWK